MSKREFLTLVIDGQQFGVPVTEVHDVLRAQAVTRVPKSRPEVAGVLNLRGRIVTAIDLRTRLDLPPRAADAGSMHVVVHHRGEPYGLVVDGVGDVVSLPDSACEPTPANLNPRWKSLASGVYRLAGQLLLVLDVSHVLGESPAKRREPAMARLIVAEDNDALRDLFAAILREAGHDVDAVANGKQAIAACRAAPYDAVVTDMFMPDCDGVELMMALWRAGSPTPIIAISGGFRGHRDVYLRMAKELGALTVLPKPIAPQALVDAVAQALATSRPVAA